MLQVKLDLVTPDGQRPGDDLEVGVKVINSTPGKKNVRIKLTLASAFYTGVVGKHVQQEVFEKAIEDGECKTCFVTLELSHFLCPCIERVRAYCFTVRPSVRLRKLNMKT